MSQDHDRLLHVPVFDDRKGRLELPRVVSVLDDVRFDLPKRYPDGEADEVTWFIMQYPRAYRYHLECADFRLRTISALYQELHRELAVKIRSDSNLLEISIGDRRVHRIYWDFESFLIEVGIALDLLARVVGTAYREETPPSFSRFCKRSTSNDTILTLFQTAQSGWVSRMKDYRDCFVHYTPADIMLSFRMVRRKSGWETRCKIPSNPNEREILRFRFPLRVELLRFALSVHRNMRKLDKDVASCLKSAYASGDYPARKHGLFFVGRRASLRGSSKEKAVRSTPSNE